MCEKDLTAAQYPYCMIVVTVLYCTVPGYVNWYRMFFVKKCDCKKVSAAHDFHWVGTLSLYGVLLHIDGTLQYRYVNCTGMEKLEISLKNITRKYSAFRVPVFGIRRWCIIRKIRELGAYMHGKIRLKKKYRHCGTCRLISISLSINRGSYLEPAGHI